MTDAAAVERLVDEAAIRRVLLRYCHGIDRADAGMIASIYHDDGIDFHGSFTGLGKDFAEHVVRHHRETFATAHFLGDSLFEFDGDTAHVQTYIRATHVAPGDPEWTLEVFFGRYLDRFERRDGRWLIARRVVVRDFMGRLPVSPMMRERPFQGQRDTTDPAYAHFAMQVLGTDRM